MEKTERSEHRRRQRLKEQEKGQGSDFWDGSHVKWRKSLKTSEIGNMDEAIEFV